MIVAIQKPCMRRVLSLIGLFAAFTVVRAEPPATTQSSSTVVGSVYGKPVTAADIELTAPIDPGVQFDSRDTAKWQQMGRIVAAFGRPVVERFVQEKKIDATADEIKAFQNHMRKSTQQYLDQSEKRLETVKQDLASPELRDEDKSKLEKERATLEKTLPAFREMTREGAPETMARQFIVAWKIERELHRTYGGRVIFQQAGPEALDARRRLFEDAEKKGDLKFGDPGVRHVFYFYANMKHTDIDESAIERPWFLEDSN